MESGPRQGPRQRPYRMRARAWAAEATARAITAAARALFAERAYDEVSLPAIADRAAVTVQTVLRRFGSKEELFAAAARSTPWRRTGPQRTAGAWLRRRVPRRRTRSPIVRSFHGAVARTGADWHAGSRWILN
jgi:hypothetical protein